LRDSPTLPADIKPVAAGKSAAPKECFLNRLKQIPLFSHRGRNIFLSFFRIYAYAVPSRSEGRFAVVTDVEAGCGGRVDVAAWLSMPTNSVDAHGQVAWSWHPDADACATRVSALSHTVANKPGAPGRTRSGRSNHRAGNAGSFR